MNLFCQKLNRSFCPNSSVSLTGVPVNSTLWLAKPASPLPICFLTDSCLLSLSFISLTLSMCSFFFCLGMEPRLDDGGKPRDRQFTLYISYDTLEHLYLYLFCCNFLL